MTADQLLHHIFPWETAPGIPGDPDVEVGDLRKDEAA
jgi:hypothetical protein